MKSRSDLPFSMAEYRERLENVRRRMASMRLDALLVTVPANIYYLTGYETQGLWMFNGLVLPLTGEPFMVTRLAEDTVVEADTWIEVSRPFRDTDMPMAVLANALREFGLDRGTLGFESDSYFFRTGEHAALGTALPNCSLRDAAGLIEAERVIKSAAELDYMRRAAVATDAGMAAAVKAVRENVIENEIAAEAYAGLLRAGSHYCPVAPWIVSGPRSFVSHATWRDRKVKAGDCVFMELGGCVHRYQTGMMRSVFVGKPTKIVSELEMIIREATDAAMEAIRPGVPTGEADAAARQAIARNSHGATQYTRVGYSMGLAFPPGWGEGHIIDIKHGDQRLFKENMTFHLIPYLQVPGQMAVAMSETIVVTRNGCERLTSFERRVFHG